MIRVVHPGSATLIFLSYNRRIRISNTLRIKTRPRSTLQVPEAFGAFSCVGQTVQYKISQANNGPGCTREVPQS
jgi:hypothetical protein